MVPVPQEELAVAVRPAGVAGIVGTAVQFNVFGLLPSVDQAEVFGFCA
jgi:hypothetical protein